MIKLSISNLAWDAKLNDEVYSLMQKYDFTGLEIAPTKIFPETPYLHIEEATEWANNFRKRWGFEIPSMQSIWYGKKENIFVNETERKVLLDYTKSAIDFAASINCKNLVFGCPKNRNIPDDLDVQDCNTIAVDFFKQLGNYAVSKGTCVGMEANPEIYGTNFITKTQDAINLIKQVDSEGFKLNLDVGTMIQNEENISLLHGNIDIINHVHISEPFLKKITKREIHKELINFLKSDNFNGFVSIEMGLQEKIYDVEEDLQYLRNL